MKKLASQLNDIWPTLMKGFEKYLNDKWLGYWEQPFTEWIKDKKTEEITKQVSPLFNLYLKKELAKIGLKVVEGNGSDYVWNGIPIEGKLSLSSDNSWTGNGFKKVSWHLLVKINFNNDGLIENSFACLVPLSECKSKWTEKKKNVNFSGLKLLTVDYDKIIKVAGDFKKNSVYLKPLFV